MGSPAWVGGCAQWDSVRRYALTSSQCDINWRSAWITQSHAEGQIDEHLSRVVLNNDLTGTVKSSVIRNYRTGESRYAGKRDITWQMEGFEFSIYGESKHRLAFERYERNDYYSYYTDDENRITCSAE